MLLFVFVFNLFMGKECNSALSVTRHIRAIGHAIPRYPLRDISATSGFANPCYPLRDISAPSGVLQHFKILKKLSKKYLICNKKTSNCSFFYSLFYLWVRAWSIALAQCYLMLATAGVAIIFYSESKSSSSVVKGCSRKPSRIKYLPMGVKIIITPLS